MEAIFVIIIVVVVVFWACWSSYRTLTGKSGGCSCTGSCSKDDCVELLENNGKS
ncbi:MAG: FeoB-associated Cys-rich membrane protein [Planctomycetes bacterium]|nr:FeoB-associated Cys-rich membrane protein [Planctomycetota bacterium]